MEGCKKITFFAYVKIASLDRCAQVGFAKRDKLAFILNLIECSN